MAAHMKIPADLTADDITWISHNLDIELNSIVFCSLLNGVHVLSTSWWDSYFILN